MHCYRFASPDGFSLHRADGWVPFPVAAGLLAAESQSDVSDEYRALCDGAAVALACFTERLGFTVGDVPPSLDEVYVAALPCGPAVFAARHFGDGDLFAASRAAMPWLGVPGAVVLARQ
jgi:hypothetical protein